MDEISTGELARRSRLSPKALRLYDEVGLLAPVRAVADYWAGGETENSERRRLAGYLVDGISGKRSVMYEVSTREIPARSLLCLKRNLAGGEQAWALGEEFIAIRRRRQPPRNGGRLGRVAAGLGVAARVGEEHSARRAISA
ncbi:MAG TPA: MerR family DNA-binding transcriptional regulator [Solirubrobacteraceae bacterium]|nr:MerR family DNA-binding transcriptional regulator [Solirubrobacteraceae bacterium]